MIIKAIGEATSFVKYQAKTIIESLGVCLPYRLSLLMNQ